MKTSTCQINNEAFDFLYALTMDEQLELKPVGTVAGHVPVYFGISTSCC